MRGSSKRGGGRSARYDVGIVGFRRAGRRRGSLHFARCRSRGCRSAGPARPAPHRWARRRWTRIRAGPLRGRSGGSRLAARLEPLGPARNRAGCRVLGPGFPGGRRGLGGFGCLGCSRFADRHGSLTGHHMGRGFPAVQEIAGEVRNQASQHGGGEESQCANECHQHARRERTGDCKEEEGEGEGSHHGSELVHGQRTDPDPRSGADPARHEKRGNDQWQHDPQAQEEEAAQVPQVVTDGKHRNQRGNKKNQRGAEHGEVTDREGSQNGLVLLAGLPVHRETRLVAKPGRTGVSLLLDGRVQLPVCWLVHSGSP